MKQMFIVGMGGFIGSACRFWLSSMAYRVFGQDFPYGTLLVNVLGSFLIGFLMAMFEGPLLVGPSIRIFLTIGILGGFTTFSTFSFETIALLREGSYLSATANVAYTLLVCLAATWLGSVLGKTL